MTTLTDALRDLEGRMTALGRHDAVRALRPGAAPDRTSATLADRGLPALPDVQELFAWHDGVEPPPDDVMDDVQVFPGYHLLSLGEALEDRDVGVEHRGWDPLWLPVLANVGGDFFAVDLGALPGRVVRVMGDEAERPVVFTSVHGLVTTLVDAYERGVVRVEGGYLELDDRAFGRLAAEREPGLAWWPAYVAGDV